MPEVILKSDNESSPEQVGPLIFNLDFPSLILLLN